MLLESASSSSDASLLTFVKVQSGRRIEEARRKGRISQEQLARQVGVGVRWLREIESGNPSVRLDDHLHCSRQLRLTTGHLLFPLLFVGHGMTFPPELANTDLRDIERRCIDLVAELSLARIAEHLTPPWRRAQSGRQG